LHHIQFQKILAYISYFCVSDYLIIALILVILPVLFHEGVFVAGGRGSVNGVSSFCCRWKGKCQWGVKFGDLSKCSASLLRNMKDDRAKVSDGIGLSHACVFL